MSDSKKGEARVKMLTVGPVATNCYVLYREGADVCAVIDPGASGDRIAEFLKKEGLRPEVILLTHGHFDHYEGVPELTARMGGKVYILDKEKELISDPHMNGSLGLMGNGSAIEPEFTVRDGEVLSAAGFDFKVIHTPGHTGGGCCYYVEDEDLLFAGDTIFMESIGRTDLPTGNMREILDSIREKILTLPDQTRIMPGHGPVTDVAYETANNPYA
ncbi:MAG: MBL fold metallo-hydrolase [Eubacterium sp.]|nr:MBL fold metallo-hydrolase [Eubacterium sp.]